MAAKKKDAPVTDEEVGLNSPSSEHDEFISLINKNPKWTEKVLGFRTIERLEALKLAVKTYNTYEAALDIIDSKYFVSQSGGKSLVYAEPEKANDELTALSHTEFLKHYGHKLVPRLIGIKDGKPYIKEENIYQKWLKHEKRRQYHRGIKFYPGSLSEKDAKNYYNSWRGFPVKGKEGDWSKIKYHLEHVWCQDNVEYYTFLMAWFADIIQDPKEKKGTAIVIKGGKGWGKSLIFDVLLTKIFGYTYIKLDKTEQVTGKFNQHLQGRLLLVLEEAVWAGDKISEGTLKSMITDTAYVIEGKGLNPEKVDSYFRLAFVSNERQAVPATKDERRFFALNVSDEYFGNKKYFDELIYEIKNGGAEAFMYHLENLDISKISLRQAPLTEALFEDIKGGMSTIERFLYDLLHEDWIKLEKNATTSELWGKPHTKDYLFEYFKEWQEKAKNVFLHKHDITTQHGFTREFNAILPFKNIKIRTERGYLFPSKEVARKMFEAKVKSKVTWMDDESDNLIDEDYEATETEIFDLLEKDGFFKPR